MRGSAKRFVPHALDGKDQLMHSAIVVIKMPDQPHTAPSNQKWLAFMADVDHLRHREQDHVQEPKGVARLAENVWLVNFLDNPAALARLVSCAAQHRLPYGILQLDAAPQWLPAGSDPIFD
jgi:hypothetical protein